ncbi:conjugal transfer protein TraG N-terminal domain-containing protein [Xenorhabdus sp. TH1]|uniref:conjugal transfer protein TraG N-terminal domain-containing protein n=1 Tax=Xenorhabdus sp. TH1 TaxID=3130166 RepID=UPI0030D141EB
MEFQVFTTGGAAEMMAMVFNALAMLNTDGVLAGAFKIALLLAVIGYVIKSAADSGRTISFQHAAVSIVLFLCFFQVTTRVTIEDTTTGEIRAVDNVPFGVGFTASIISRTSYEFSKKIEQAFSTPSMTEYGPIDPLYMMSAMYDAARDPLTWTKYSQGVDIDNAIQTFTSQCLSFDIARGAQSYLSIMNKPMSDEFALSPNRRILLPKADGTTGTMEVTCREAMKTIKSLVAREKNSLADGIMDVRNSYSTRCNQNALTSKDRCTPAFAENSMQDTLLFYSNSGTDLRQFQTMLLMYPYMVNMPSTVNENAYHYYAAVAKNQSQIQQSFKWASEGSSFLIWVQYLQSFVQAAVYGLVPFVAFTLAFGMMGMGLALKYILVLLWVQTWQPLMAIMNAILLTKTQSDLSVLSSGITTFNDLYHILDVTQKNIALAGHLMASVPVLGAFVVFGSSYAFMGLTGNLSSTNSPDTEPLAPAATDSAPINTTSALSSHSAHNAVSAMTGTDQTGPSLNIGRTLSSNVQSSRQRLENAQKQFNAVTGSNVNVGTGLTETGSVNQDSTFRIGDTHTHNQDTSVSNVNSGGTGNINTRLTNSTDQLSSGIEGKFGVSIPNNNKGGNKGDNGKSPFSGSISGSINTSSSVADTKTDSTTVNTGNQISRKTGDTIVDANQLSANTGKGWSYSKNGQVSGSHSSTRSYQDALSELQSAQKAYNEAVSLNNSIGTQQTFKPSQVAYLADNNQAALTKIENKNLGNQEYQNLKQQYAQQLSTAMNRSDAEQAAILYAANDNGTLAPYANELFGPSVNAESLNPSKTQENADLAKGVEEDVNKGVPARMADVNNKGALIDQHALNQKDFAKDETELYYGSLNQQHFEDLKGKFVQIEEHGQNAMFYSDRNAKSAEALTHSTVNTSEALSQLGTGISNGMKNITGDYENIKAVDQQELSKITDRSAVGSSLTQEQARNIGNAFAEFGAVAKNVGSIQKINDQASRFMKVYRENGGTGTDTQVYTALNQTQRSMRLGDGMATFNHASNALVGGSGDKIPHNPDQRTVSGIDITPYAVQGWRSFIDQK